MVPDAGATLRTMKILGCRQHSDAPMPIYVQRTPRKLLEPWVFSWRRRFAYTPLGMASAGATPSHSDKRHRDTYPHIESG